MTFIISIRCLLCVDMTTISKQPWITLGDVFILPWNGYSPIFSLWTVLFPRESVTGSALKQQRDAFQSSDVCATLCTLQQPATQFTVFSVFSRLTASCRVELSVCKCFSGVNTIIMAYSPSLSPSLSLSLSLPLSPSLSLPLSSSLSPLSPSLSLSLSRIYTDGQGDPWPRLVWTRQSRIKVNMRQTELLMISSPHPKNKYITPAVINPPPPLLPPPFRSTTLIFANKKEQDILWKEELQKLNKTAEG